MTFRREEVRNLFTVLALAFAFWTFPSGLGAQDPLDSIPDPGGESETSLSAWAAAYLKEFSGSSASFMASISASSRSTCAGCTRRGS